MKSRLPKEENGRKSRFEEEDSRIPYEEALKEIEMQKAEIQRLREKIEQLERGRSRPISREKLPPMEGFERSTMSLQQPMTQ